MPLKRKYTVTLIHPQLGSQIHIVEAETMKTVDGNVILMDYNEDGCFYNEVAFFTPPANGSIQVTSVSV